MSSPEPEDLGGLVDNAEPVAVEKVSVTDSTDTAGVTLEESNKAISNGGYSDPKAPIPATSIEGTTNNNYKPGLPPGVALYKANGKRVVVAADRHSVQPNPCPVKAKNIKYFYLFSVISIMLFFPTGFLAMMYAVKTRRQMVVGASNQDWTLCRKYSKRCQNLVIFSFIGFFVTLAVAVAVLEMTYFKHDDAYWDHRFSGHAFG